MITISQSIRIKKTKYNFNLNLTVQISISSLMIFSSFLILLATSCGRNKSKDQNLVDSTENFQTMYSEEEINFKTETNIPINLTVTHPDELLFEETMRYKSIMSEDSLMIYPSSHNYDGFHSQKPYTIPLIPSFEYSEDVEYLCLDAVITNNTDSPIITNELILYVESSFIDKSPYLYLCTVEDTANTLFISNESWVAHGGFTLEYSLLKKDEQFNGKYENKKEFINYEDVIAIDFTEDMKQMGYDFETLKNKFMWSEDSCLTITTDDTSESPSSLFYPFEWSTEEKLGTTFYIGFCRLVGRIILKQNYPPIEFTAHLSLSTAGGFGADFDYNDHFEFELQNDNSNYIIKRPYNMTLRPQASEKIALKIKCEKSSYHKFKIKAISDNDLEISSIPISLHFMMPKHAIQTMNLRYNN